MDYKLYLKWDDVIKVMNVDGAHALSSPPPGTDKYELSTASEEVYLEWIKHLISKGVALETISSER